MAEANATTQYETAASRVTRWEIPPGAETGVHVHEYDYVVVPVVDGVLTVTDPAGESVDVPIAIGESYGRAAGVHHNVSNRTDETVVFVEIELLEHGLPTA